MNQFNKKFNKTPMLTRQKYKNEDVIKGLESVRKKMVISMFAHKGGVGKTTLLFNIIKGLMLRNMNMKILLFDLDPQMNLTSLILTEEEYDEHIEYMERKLDEEKGVEPALNDNILDIYLNNIISVPTKLKPYRWSEGNDGLTKVDFIKGSFEIPKWTSSLCTDVIDLGPQSQNFRKFIQSFKTEYTLVFLDLGPNMNPLNIVCLLSSDSIIYPICADKHSKTGLKSLKRNIYNQYKKKFAEAKLNNQNIEPKFMGIIINKIFLRARGELRIQKMFDLEKNSVESTREVIKKLGLGNDVVGFLRNFFSQSSKMSEEQLSIFDLKGDNKFLYKDDMNNLIDRMILLINGIEIPDWIYSDDQEYVEELRTRQNNDEMDLDETDEDEEEIQDEVSNISKKRKPS
jgi:cellulose biosynthesis protein BcsQ